MTPKTQVPGSEATGVTASPAVTPAVQPGVTAEPAVTPAAQPSPDAETARIKAEYDKKLEKYEQDLNKMKSSLQSQSSQKDREWQAKYDELQEQLNQARMSKMTAEERKEYEQQLRDEELGKLQEQLESVQTERQTMAQILDAAQFFLNRGVPANKLVMNEGYDALARSGWDYIDAELAELRKQKGTGPTAPEQPANPAALHEAPEVDTTKGPPSPGPTWAAYRAKGISDEDVYRNVESGRWPSSAIPQS